VSCLYRNSIEVIPEGQVCWQPTGNSTLHRGLVLTLALLMIAHVAAALKHKFVDRDGVAGRMGI
jgi:cytochrome b561